MKNCTHCGRPTGSREFNAYVHDACLDERDIENEIDVHLLRGERPL